MSKLEGSGPAFPAKLATGRTIFAVRETASAIETVPVEEVNEHPGMSLRDYFAGQALASLGTWTPLPQVANLWSDAACEARATLSYKQADAMLAARKAAA